MKPVAVVLVAALGLGGARVARTLASSRGPHEQAAEPYAPSPAAAPFLSLGYHELAADLLWIRMIGYFGGRDSSADAIADLAEAIEACDPDFRWVYDYGANAMTIATHGVTQRTYLRAVGLLERGMTRFTEDWKLPYLASDIYSQDLQTKDPAQRRAWDERSVSLMESAIRKPGAPPEAATWAATMRTRMGQHQRAVQGLREMILITSSPETRKRLIQKLADLEDADSSELAAELYEEKHRFELAWHTSRPTIPITMYVLIGPRSTSGFDMADLATGGRTLIGSAPAPEKLPPIE